MTMKNSDLTHQNRFTVYNASAGSGKTYTLVKEYLLLLLSSPRKDSYRNILAITFTNKAVAEMKSRVILNLYALGRKVCPEDCKDLLNELSKETGLDESVIQIRAQKLLKNILHNYAGFDISTIDRFSHKIIRSFAKDLGIPVNFEVEMNINQVLKEAVDRVINRAGEDPKLTKALLNFTLTKADDDKSWDISRDLFEFAGLLTQENHREYVSVLKSNTLEDFAEFSVKIKKEIVSTEYVINSRAEDFYKIVSREGLDKKCFNGGYLFTYFEKLKSNNYPTTWGANWQNDIETKPLYSKSVLADKKSCLDKCQPEIVELFYTTRAGIFRIQYLKEILRNLSPLSLLNEISREIDEIKKERSLILISDFNPTIAAEINHQPAPFIYERLGERYRNYFIDEFQDTSGMQWRNMIPLIDHSLSSQQAVGETASLTIVGDAKQSIYRFRGGEAEQFINLYGEKNNPFAIPQEVINLPHNYRSAPEIVNFNNSFFSFVSHKFVNPVYKDLFNTSSQKPKKEFPGYINLSFPEIENKEEEMEIHPQKVLEIVQDLRNNGTSISDICVLTRTRKQSSAVATILNENGIAIVSSESLLISNSPEVKFINTLLEFSLNPEDLSLRWNILSYLCEKLECKDPHLVFKSNLELPKHLFFNWLKDFGIYFDFDKLQKLSLYEGAEYIIRAFNLIREGSDAYLQFYLDFIFEKTGKNFEGLTTFLELWEQEKEKLSIMSPKTSNAVQIMTIHQSKGLEFQVVIFPFANFKIKDVSRDYIWIPLPDGLNEIPVGYLKASDKMLNWGESEAAAYQERLDQSEFDNINVLYVAFTRAVRQLYIVSNFDINKKGEEDEKKVSGLLINYLKNCNLWDGGYTYEIGKKSYSSLEELEISEAVKPEEYFSSPTRSSAVQLITRNGSLFGSTREEAIEKGLIVHDILSEINSSEDIETAMQKFIRYQEPSAEDEKEIRFTLNEIVNHTDLIGYFSPTAEVEKERDIISPNGEILRPDRLNFYSGKVTIIDYKTGNTDPAHKNQMQEYESLLSSMGFEVDKKILIYINKHINLVYV